jgi:ParB-like chromosome segregation protein Spo0J
MPVKRMEGAVKPSQTMENVRAGGRVEQRSSISTDQLMRGIDAAGDVRQLVEAAGTDLKVIADELAKLRTELHRYDPSAATVLERLERAEAAARSDDSEGVLMSLLGMGRWVLDFATKIGASVVARIIEKQMGF